MPVAKIKQKLKILTSKLPTDVSVQSLLHNRDLSCRPTVKKADHRSLLQYKTDSAFIYCSLQIDDIILKSAANASALYL